MGNPFLDALGWVGESLDKPGAAVRGLLAGRPDQLANLIPFSDTIGITDPSQRTSGRSLLESLGALSSKEDGSGFDLGDLAGIGADIATNPLTYLGPAGAIKGVRSLMGRGGTAAREADTLMAGQLNRLGVAGKSGEASTFSLPKAASQAESAAAKAGEALPLPKAASLAESAAAADAKAAVDPMAQLLEDSMNDAEAVDFLNQLGQAGEVTPASALKTPTSPLPASLPATAAANIGGTTSGPLESMLERMANAAEAKPQSMANMLADRRKFPVVEFSKGADETSLAAKIRGHLPGDEGQRFTRRQLPAFANESKDSGYLGEYLRGPDRAAFVHGHNIADLEPWQQEIPGSSLREVRRHEVTHGLNELARSDSMRGIAYGNRIVDPTVPDSGLKKGLGLMMDETLARASELPGPENQISHVLHFLSDQGLGNEYRRMAGIYQNSPYTNFMMKDAPAIIKGMRDQLVAAPKETLPALLRALAEKAGQTGLAVSPLAMALGSDNG